MARNLFLPRLIKCFGNRPFTADDVNKKIKGRSKKANSSGLCYLKKKGKIQHDETGMYRIVTASSPPEKEDSSFQIDLNDPAIEELLKAFTKRCYVDRSFFMEFAQQPGVFPAILRFLIVKN